MIYVYAPVITDGILDLTKELGGTVLRKFDGMQFLQKGRPVEFKANDVVICWGAHVPSIPNITMLNDNLKYPDQLIVNRKAYSIPGIGLCLHIVDYGNNITYKQDMENKAKGVYKNKSGMVPSTEFYGCGTPYYTFKSEYQLHVFNGKIIHGAQTNIVMGQRVASKITAASAKVITQAQNALQLLGLDFAKVTLMYLADGPVIRKIITAPKLTPDLVAIYAASIREFINASTEVKQATEDIV